MFRSSVLPRYKGICLLSGRFCSTGRYEEALPKRYASLGTPKSYPLQTAAAPLRENDLAVQVIPDHLTATDVVNDRVSRESQMHDGKMDAFSVFDLGDVINKFKKWVTWLPRVKPFYAVKCNPSEEILKVLAHMGTGFDCASEGEVRSVLSAGVAPGRIIYAHPCKQPSSIRYAGETGVRLMTFDNPQELLKIKQTAPDTSLVLRIRCPAAKALVELNTKYGCPPHQAEQLLNMAAYLGLNVVGVSFHVGSGCLDSEAFSRAVGSARRLFDSAGKYGFDFRLLDVGGGFPGMGNAELTFERITESDLGPALDRHFPGGCGVQVIAEPGRFFTESAMRVAVNVIAKKHSSGGFTDLKDVDDDTKTTFEYYVNDGVYGSFRHAPFQEPYVIRPSSVDVADKHHRSHLWGPTCDDIDIIFEDHMLPELELGDWLVFQGMGAYTASCASRFNGFRSPKCHYVIQEKYVPYLSQA